MTTAIATQKSQPIVAFEGEHLEAIKSMCTAAKLTDEEFKQFIIQCRRTRLDPVTRQIYAIKDGNGKMTIITSIDGFRVIADRSDKYEGQLGPFWCGDDGEWRDVWLSSTPPKAARVGVMKNGFQQPLYAVAIFDEYAKRYTRDDTYNRPPKYKAGDLQGQWPKMPALMIAKVAEALALRKAFPNDLSDVYTDIEMEQAADDTPAPVVQVQIPAQVEPVQVVRSASKPVILAAPQSPAVAPQPVAPTDYIPAEWEAFEAKPEPVAPKPAPAPTVAPAPTPPPVALAPEPQQHPSEYMITFGRFRGKAMGTIDAPALAEYVDLLLSECKKSGKPIAPVVQQFIDNANYLLQIK